MQLSQRIEVYDETKKWREAEVVDFSDDGGHQVKVHFRGFKHSFDTWVPRAVDRIRPYGREKNLKNKRRPDNHHPPLYSHPPHHNQQQQRLQASLNPNASHTRQLAVTSDRYSHYREALARQQLAIVPVEGDGNCLFRSVSHQVYGTDAYHSLVREKVMAYMEVERQYFEPYVEGDMADFLRYLEVKRRDGVWGDDPEVQAICELYDRPAVIWVYDAAQGAKKLRTFHEAGGFSSRPDRQPMMLSYYGGGHYDSIMATDQLMGGPPVSERGSTAARPGPGGFMRACIYGCACDWPAAAAAADDDMGGPLGMTDSGVCRGHAGGGASRRDGGPRHRHGPAEERGGSGRGGDEAPLGRGGHRAGNSPPNEPARKQREAGERGLGRGDVSFMGVCLSVGLACWVWHAGCGRGGAACVSRGLRLVHGPGDRPRAQRTGEAHDHQQQHHRKKGSQLAAAGPVTDSREARCDAAQAEIQAELLRSAAEQSEAELVKKVMEDSLKDDDAGQQVAW